MKLLLPVLFGFLMAGCVHRSDCCALLLPEMIRTQTQCSDPWGYGATTDETIMKLRDYLLLQYNIPTTRVTLQSTGENITCAACNCSSGNAFHVFITEQPYIDSLKKHGFVLK